MAKVRRYGKAKAGRRSTKSRSGRTRKTSRALYNNPTLVRTVRKVVSNLTEDKMAFFNMGNTLTMFNSGINSTGDMLQLVPNISQGVDNNQRIGDTIIAKSLSVKGYLKLNTNDIIDSTKLPSVIARVMIVSLKYRSSYTDGLYAYPLDSLLKKGGTQTAFTGILSDINAPINRDLFTVHHDKKFYLNQSFMASPGTQPTQPAAIVASDISQTVKFFNFKVRCKNKKIRYDPLVGSNVEPTNFAPIMLIGYAYLDGSAADSISTNLGVAYSTDFRYEDN